MKVNRALRAEIRRSVVAATGIRRPGIRVGHRDANDIHGKDWQPNCLLWGPDTDLGDNPELAALDEINDDPANPGCHMLDLYVYECQRHNSDWPELVTNVYMFLRDGKVIGTAFHEKQVEPMRAQLNFPHTRGW